MKVTTLDNLRELLNLMDNSFGSKELSINHRIALNNYIINIDVDYENDLEINTDQIITENTSSSALGFGVLGVMTLGKSYDVIIPTLGVGELGKIILWDL